MKIAQLLEKTNSSYNSAFKELYNQIVYALEEAQDIDLHLKPLQNYFELIESSDFEDLIEIFRPMFHTICLVWANSKWYCRPVRIVVLLQEINNSLIFRANEYLDPLDLFKGEIEESMEKIRTTFNIMNAYRNIYNEHKEKLGSYFKKGNSPKLWKFEPNIVFACWDRFVDRLSMIHVGTNVKLLIVF